MFLGNLKIKAAHVVKKRKKYRKKSKHCGACHKLGLVLFSSADGLFWLGEILAFHPCSFCPIAKDSSLYACIIIISK